MTIKTRDLNLWQQKNYKYDKKKKSWELENYEETDIKKLCLSFYDKKNYVLNYIY